MLQHLETSPHDGSYLDDPSTPIVSSRPDPCTPPGALTRGVTRTPDHPTVQAINDTEKVTRTMSRVEPPVRDTQKITTEQEANMVNLKKVILKMFY